MNLSQDEINAMLKNDPTAGDAEMDLSALDFSEAAQKTSYEGMLTAQEADVLGEVGNMCMGAVATTMYTLLDRRVSITTPKVSVHTTQEVLDEYQTPFVVVEVEYTEGIDGKNLLLLREWDAALITDLLMGGDGVLEEPIELSELHMSAINEIMNQMIGASATVLSKVIREAVNISPPTSTWVDTHSDVSAFLDAAALVVKISFDMEIEGLLNSQLLQVLPYELGRGLAEKLQANISALSEPAEQPRPAEPAPPQQAAPPPSAAPAAAPAAAPQTVHVPPQQSPPPVPGQLVDVRPMNYPSFDARPAVAPVSAKGMNLIQDIPLQVTVELGKTRKDISEILEFGMGTVVMLDKMAGEPVEILANGKVIARGEVVVIDENYGARITEIISDD